MVFQQKLLPVTTFREWPEQIYECVKEQSQNIDPNSWKPFQFVFFFANQQFIAYYLPQHFRKEKIPLHMQPLPA